jgi:hypothetical protein
MQAEANMPEHTNLPGSDLDANFVGWQESMSGDFFPLFMITVAGHPSYQSTVSVSSLRRMGLRVPPVLSPYPGKEPSPWHNLVFKLNHPKTPRNKILKDGLDYTVVKKPLESKSELKQDVYATARMDTDKESISAMAVT